VLPEYYPAAVLLFISHSDFTEKEAKEQRQFVVRFLFFYYLLLSPSFHRQCP